MKILLVLSTLAVICVAGCKMRTPMPTGAENVPPVIDLPAPPKEDKKTDQNATAAPIAVTISTPKTQFSRGETINFHISARNISDRAQTVTFTSGQSFDVVAHPANANDDDPIWRWSMDKMFIASLREITLKPGDAQKFTATWDQNEGAGQVVPRGKYRVRGQLTTNPIVESALLEIELVN